MNTKILPAGRQKALACRSRTTFDLPLEPVAAHLQVDLALERLDLGGPHQLLGHLTDPADVRVAAREDPIPVLGPHLLGGPPADRQLLLRGQGERLLPAAGTISRPYGCLGESAPGDQGGEPTDRHACAHRSPPGRTAPRRAVRSQPC